MKRMPPSQRPLRRTDRLIIHEMFDEVLVYDKITDQAHCLNQTAALVWGACDGQLEPQEIARKLATQLPSDVSENIVMLALAELEKVRLLERDKSAPVSFARLSRRQMVRSLSLAAAVALPVVTSITAPTPAQAATCTPPGQPCNPVKLCCTSCNPAAPGGPKCF